MREILSSVQFQYTWVRDYGWVGLEGSQQNELHYPNPPEA